VIPILPFRATRPTAAKAREFSLERMEHLSADQILETAGRLPLSLAALVQAAMAGEGAAKLASLRADKALLQEPEPTVYMHRQVKGGRKHCGLVAGVRADAFTSGVIRAHRHVRGEDAAQWRLLTERCAAQVDSVILGFETNEVITDLFEREVNDRPLFHVVAGDGATHTLWSGRRAADLAMAFAEVRSAYVLEGHHRLQNLQPNDPVLCMLLPLNEVFARWSPRLVRPSADAAWHAWLQSNAELVAEPGMPAAGFADACVLRDGAPAWMRFRLPPPPLGATLADATDSGRLDALLRAVLGADALAATANRPGEDRVMQLQALLAGGAWGSVIVLSHPPVRELTLLADAGERLPAGSTWFEPRVRSGLWLHHHG